MYADKKDNRVSAYYVILILMAISLPLSKFTMSLFQFALVVLWFWDSLSIKRSREIFHTNTIISFPFKFISYLFSSAGENFIHKLKIFFNNRAALVVSSIFIIHVIGLIHSSDYSWAMKDLRTKLPILSLTIIIATMPQISRRQFSVLMYFFIGAVIIGTLFSLNELLKQEFTDIRKISIFISPIRFSLNICIAIFSSIYFIYIRNNIKPWAKFLMGIATLWLIVFLVILESGIGMIILLFLTCCLLFYLIIKIKNLLTQGILISLLLLIPIILFIYVNGIIKQYSACPKVDFASLDKYTSIGNPYVHDTINFEIEDGRYVGLYISKKEVRNAWNERSDFKFSGKDEKNQFIKYTLYRFLTSKDYRKDAQGISKLSEKEVRAIERGIANINYLESPNLKTRIMKIIMGYHNFKDEDDPNGNSIMQRIEYWKASGLLIKNNFIVGVGIGDVPSAFAKQYQEMDTNLKKQWRWRSHNQFMTIFIALGVFGFMWFIFALLYPGIKTGNIKDYFYLIFMVTILLSMLTEDTLETQAGVTLFAFFNALLLFGRKPENLKK